MGFGMLLYFAKWLLTEDSIVYLTSQIFSAQKVTLLWWHFDLLQEQ